MMVHNPFRLYAIDSTRSFLYALMLYIGCSLPTSHLRFSTIEKRVLIAIHQSPHSHPFPPNSFPSSHYNPCFVATTFHFSNAQMRTVRLDGKIECFP